MADALGTDFVGWVERTRETHRIPRQGSVGLPSTFDPPHKIALDPPHRAIAARRKHERSDYAIPRVRYLQLKKSPAVAAKDVSWHKFGRLGFLKRRNRPNDYYKDT
jgi:hypothetical protein